MGAVEVLAIALIVAAVYGFRTIGRSNSRGFHQIQRYSPPVDVVLAYRSESGVESARRVAVLRSLRHEDGRLYLLGFTGSRNKPTTYRVDRIVNIATVDGETIDRHRFLTDWLAIPRNLWATGEA